MTLSALIKKGGLAHAATATHATVATHEPPNVATVATVAVADTPGPKTVNPENSRKTAKVDDIVNSANSVTGIFSRNPEVELDSSEFHERAGFALDNPNIPDHWIDGFSILISMPLPKDWHQENWDFVLSSAENFLAEWGSKAHALGWSNNDVFGISQTGSMARIDRRGLVLMLADRRVSAMTGETAALECLNHRTGQPNGSTLTFYRKQDMSGSVPLWELEAVDEIIQKIGD